MSSAFYERDEWRKIRFRVLNKFGFRCMACGVTAKDGAIIQVDHIKPVSIYPELALDESNLQVLCKACNLGKSNRFINDLRPTPEPRLTRVRPKLMRRLPKEQRRKHALAKLSQRIKRKLAHAEASRDAETQMRLMKEYLNIQRMMRKEEAASA